MEYCFFNNEIRKASETAIAINDRGFTLGDGLFETICVKKGVVYRFDDHMERLEHGLDVLSLTLEKNRTEIKEAIEKLISANSIKNALLRITVSRGVAPRGINIPSETSPTFLITAAETKEIPTKPLKLIVSEKTRRNELSPICQCKTLNYLDNIIARQEAVEKNADDAVILNTKDMVAETPVANIFLVIDKDIFTPPAADGALKGVMRKTLIESFGIKEKSLKKEDLMTVEEIFVSNASGIKPVSEINGKELSSQKTALKLLNEVFK